MCVFKCNRGPWHWHWRRVSIHFPFNVLIQSDQMAFSVAAVVVVVAQSGGKKNRFSFLFLSVNWKNAPHGSQVIVILLLHTAYGRRCIHSEWSHLSFMDPFVPEKGMVDEQMDVNSIVHDERDGDGGSNNETKNTWMNLVLSLIITRNVEIKWTSATTQNPKIRTWGFDGFRFIARTFMSW